MTTRRRGANPAQRATTAERRTKACKLRIAGKSWQEIADELGYSGKNAAAMDVNRALEANLTECRQVTEVLREQELQRLDVLWADAWAVLKRRHVTVSYGNVVMHDGEPLLDDAPVLTAIDRLLKIQERRAKFLGLDAAAKVELLTVDAIDDQIRTLVAQLEQVNATAAELDADQADEAAGVEAATD